MPKKRRCKAPVDDFDLILGGLAVTTFWSVSRMEVREGTIGAPEIVVSQYR